MNNLVVNQTQVFLIFILCGALIGLFFDFFRILRKSFKTPDFVTYIEDILFWILTCIFLAYSIFKYNNGEIRAFIFIGLFIGITLYILLISKTVIKISTSIILAINQVLKNIIKYISYPINIAFSVFRKLFFKPISFIFINIRKNLSNSFKKIYKNQQGKQIFKRFSIFQK